MEGEWYGNGIWNEDKKWEGNGSWNGGYLHGNWDGIGEWVPMDNGKGKWRGNGVLKSSMWLKKYSELKLFIIKRLIAVIAIELIAVAAICFGSNLLVINKGSIGIDERLIIIAVIFIIIALLSLVLFVIGGIETDKGKWWAEGTWEDEGEFRILDLRGKWKLGYHTGTLRGRMRDLKPR